VTAPDTPVSGAPLVAGRAGSFDTHITPPSYRPAGGCTSYGAESTVTIDLPNGRRCADCPPGFSRRYYDALLKDRLCVAAYVRTALRLRWAA
jgi:hypothetical protein